MEGIKLVIEMCVNLLNTRLTFSPFSFTIMQCLIGCACLAVVINFLHRLFDI